MQDMGTHQSALLACIYAISLGWPQTHADTRACPPLHVAWAWHGVTGWPAHRTVQRMCPVVGQQLVVGTVQFEQCVRHAVRNASDDDAKVSGRLDRLRRRAGRGSDDIVQACSRAVGVPLRSMGGDTFGRRYSTVYTRPPHPPTPLGAPGTGQLIATHRAPALCSRRRSRLRRSPAPRRPSCRAGQGPSL